MAKRILCFVLCLVMLLPALGLGVHAQTEPTTETEEQPLLERLQALYDGTYVGNEAQRLRKQILKTHIDTLEMTGNESMGGLCGGQVSYELYLLGINRILVTNHGKDHYDYYSAMETTSGGYRVRAYSASRYSMLDALNLITKNGTVDVYNLLVGFEKTNTEAGAQYGHVCYIHGILDGIVYFTEGFSTPFCTIEGEPAAVTMEQFATWFSTWAEYEGLVYFGTKSPVDSCAYYPADLFVECDAAVTLLSLPDEQLGVSVRTAALGERLHVTGLYENMYGKCYYRINTDSVVTYAPVERLEKLCLNYENVIYEKPVLPQLLYAGQMFLMGGKITTDNLHFDRLRVLITDADGQDVMEAELLENGTTCNLNLYYIRQKLDTRSLKAGIYDYSILADIKNHYMQDGQLKTETESVCVAMARFGVGQKEVPEQPTVQPKGKEDGWNYEQGKWYYYQNGEPYSGWLGYKGNDYYMNEEGQAVTGWVEINGKMRYFSETGTMRTGWVTTEQGVSYMLRNGVAAIGWRTVDGSRYYFDAHGEMLSGGWTEMDGKLFYFHANGKVATGWVTLNGQVYSFHVDGHLLAKRVQQDGKSQMIPYDGTWKP